MEVWNPTKKENQADNKILDDIIKRTLKVPMTTPRETLYIEPSTDSKSEGIVNVLSNSLIPSPSSLTEGTSSLTVWPIPSPFKIPRVSEECIKSNYLAHFHKHVHWILGAGYMEQLPYGKMSELDRNMVFLWVLNEWWVSVGSQSRYSDVYV